MGIRLGITFIIINKVYTTMKKYILGSLAVLALAACSNDELVTDSDVKSPVVEQDVNTVESTIVGEYEQLGEEDMDNGNIVETRAGVGAGNEALWSVGDELSITNGTLMYNYDVTATSNNDKDAVFKVSGDHAVHVGTESDAFYAMYPRRAITEANGAGSWNGAVVKGQIFAQQSYVENMGQATGGNNFGGYYVSTDKATVTNDSEGKTTLDFAFAPLASVIDVNLSSTGIADNNYAAVYIRDLSGGTIAANFSYNCASKVLTTTDDGGCNYNYSSRSDVIEVNFFKSETDGAVSYETLGEDKIVRFYLLPQKLNSGVEITIRTKDGKYYTKKSTASVGNAYDVSDESKITTEDGNLKGIVKPFHKKYKFGSISTARTSSWMACIPQNIFYRMLSIPGSHDSGSSTVSSLVSDYSKTQNLSIAEQLDLGIRAFDLRPLVTSSKLILSHGSAESNITLAQAITNMKDFLANHPSECIFAFIHQEKPTGSEGTDTQKATWSNNVYALVKAAVDGGYALNELKSNTKFTACRGKIIFIYRDDLTGDNKIYNAGKIAWNDNIARTVYLRGTDGNEMTDFKVSYQDIYNTDAQETSNAGLSGYFQQKAGVANDAAKVEMVKKYIDFADQSTEQILFLNFASYAGSSLSNISNHVSAIMPSVNQYIVTKHERVGIIFSDFVENSYEGKNFTTIMMANNFKHVFTKRSRVDVIKTYQSNGTGGIGIGTAGDEYADDSEVFAKPYYRY